MRVTMTVNGTVHDSEVERERFSRTTCARTCVVGWQGQHGAALHRHVIEMQR